MGYLNLKGNVMDKSWDVVGPQKVSISEVEESKLRSKAMLIIARKKGSSKVLFDRGGYLYHGKIKSFADGAREGGLIF